MALKSGRVGIHPSQVDPITGMLINVPTPGNISFEDLSDAQISNPEVGQTLIYNGNKWENEFSSISPTTLAALQDVQITDPEDGALLVYDSASGKWVNSVTPPAPVVPDGNTVTPTDDVETWLSCAGIDDKSYTTLSDILSDSITFNALLGDSNANKYMARSTTWASTLCADQYAMTMIGQYDVCCDALLGNSTWASAIVASAYVDYVINAKVPVMTSNTTPSGVCSASYANTGQEAYKAFDNNSSTLWGSYGTSNPNVNQWVGYEYTTATVIRAFELVALYDTNLRVKNFKIQGSNDGFSSDVHDLYTGATESDSSSSAKVRGFFDNSTAYKYYRLYVIDNWSSNTSIAIAIISLQFYGHATQTGKIHGANEEVAYYLDGATQVPISNPSTLDAGTYTFGSTIAKNPDSLSSDYTKQIRITPNTVEVVLRPDKSLYWWGYENGVESINAANGYTKTYYSGYSSTNPTYNARSIKLTTSSNTYAGIGSRDAISGMTKLNTILNAITTPSSWYCRINAMDSKAAFDNADGSSGATEVTSSGTAKYTHITNKPYPVIFNDSSRQVDIYAIWYE